VTPARGSTRHRLLDSAEVLLVEGGPRALTLDAVAAASAVSKGGLLHHFSTKDSLVQGLLERLADRAADDVVAMRAHPQGPVDFYLRTAVPGAEGGAGTDPLTRSVLAAVTLASAGDARARAALVEVAQGWYAVLLEAVGDPMLARVVQLVGDGLWYGATTGAPVVDDVGALTTAVQRLLAGAASAGATGPQ
jgi:AcrR family transcriptional regulator